MHYQFRSVLWPQACWKPSNKTNLLLKPSEENEDTGQTGLSIIWWRKDPPNYLDFIALVIFQLESINVYSVFLWCPLISYIFIFESTDNIPVSILDKSVEQTTQGFELLFGFSLSIYKHQSSPSLVANAKKVKLIWNTHADLVYLI